LGPPKISEYGDSGFAWAPFDTNGGHEWVVLKFRRRVFVTEVLILESLNPGAVYKGKNQKLYLKNCTYVLLDLLHLSSTHLIQFVYT